MQHYAGIDVSLELSSVCVVDATGRIVREAKVASDPEALIGWLRGLGIALARVGLGSRHCRERSAVAVALRRDAGGRSAVAVALRRDAGGRSAVAVALRRDARRRPAGRAPGDPACAGRVQGHAVKTDRKDARGIAQLLRLGWFRPVHCKSVSAQETRALLTARKLLQTKCLDAEMSLRGVLRGFGLKVGRTTPHSFAARVRELVEGHATLTAIAEALLAARETLGAQLRDLEKRLRGQAREGERARLLMSVPGVGVIVALTYAAAVDDPGRFRSSKAVGAHFGLTPKRYQSGETDVIGGISKVGDAMVRTALYEAANAVLSRPTRFSTLKRWAMEVARRRGLKRAKVALACKMGTVLHRMWVDGTEFRWGKEAQVTA